jgi:hypothetical protein
MEPLQANPDIWICDRVCWGKAQKRLMLYCFGKFNFYNTLSYSGPYLPPPLPVNHSVQNFMISNRKP